MDSSLGRPRMVDSRCDIEGKIISFLHLPNGLVFWRFCCFISSLICKGCKLLNAHKERILALFFFVLEVISVVLDQIGKDKETYLLAAFLLSVFGFAISLYSFIEARTNQTVMAETELKVVEIVFSVIQLIVTFVQYLLTVLKVKNDYNASAFPLAFAMIAVVFIFLKDGKITDSSPKDWPLANIQPIDTICSTSTELDQIGSSDNQVDTMSSVVKRSTHVRNKRVEFELELNDDKTKKKVMESVSGISGVDSISMDLKNNKLTMKGNIDPVDVVIELRTICQTELISVTPMKAVEMKKEEKKSDTKKEDEMPYRIYKAYNPYRTPYHHIKTE